MSDPDEAFFEEFEAEMERQQEAWNPHDLPESQHQLLEDIVAADGPKWMVERVAAGIYHDYVTPIAAPKNQLAKDATKAGLDDVVRKTKQGVYDP